MPIRKRSPESGPESIVDYSRIAQDISVLYGYLHNSSTVLSAIHIKHGYYLLATHEKGETSRPALDITLRNGSHLPVGVSHELMQEKVTIFDPETGKAYSNQLEQMIEEILQHALSAIPEATPEPTRTRKLGSKVINFGKRNLAFPQRSK